ncbi:MAG: hypothetical protein IPM95_05190 [Sphingobacteriales bacterium]|jgi:hypothetical protein|nr:hypothetical protein [Sphingobacteriales bacterium]
MIHYLKFDCVNLSPFQQGMLSALLVTLISIVCLVFHQDSMLAWDMLISPILLFCFYNPVLGAFQQKPLQYFTKSTLIFISIAFYILFSGNFISVFSYKQSGELHLFTALIIIFYLLMHLLTLIFRGILYLLTQIDD